MTPEGLARLSLDEGLRLTAYPDPLSGGAPYTIGFGCTGVFIKPGLTWTLAEAITQRDARIAVLENSIPPRFAEAGVSGAWDQSSPIRRDVLVNMAYQMGVCGLLGFHTMIAYLAMATPNYIGAASAMRKSAWAERQTPSRALRLSLILQNDAYPDPPPTIPAEWVSASSG